MLLMPRVSRKDNAYFLLKAAAALLPLCLLLAAGVEASLELQKSIDLDVPASQLSNNGPVIMNMAAANPSAPPTAEPQVLLSLPQVSVDLDITKQKVPLLSVADAPCKKLCKNKCDIKMEKSCINVTLPKKVRACRSFNSTC
jgi:hypothetical protein